jgi:hypothetical protein
MEFYQIVLGIFFIIGMAFIVISSIDHDLQKQSYMINEFEPHNCFVEHQINGKAFSFIRGYNTTFGDNSTIYCCTAANKDSVYCMVPGVRDES